MSDPQTKATLPSHFEQSIAQLSPSLQREMRELRQHEAKILKALGDAKKAALFQSDPLAFLRGEGVPVPATLAGRLRQFDTGVAANLRRQAFVLPNGQTVTARINVRFNRALKES